MLKIQICQNNNSSVYPEDIKETILMQEVIQAAEEDSENPRNLRMIEKRGKTFPTDIKVRRKHRN